MSHEPVGFDFRAFLAEKVEHMLVPAKAVIAKDEQHIPLLILWPYDGTDALPALMPIAGEFGSRITKDIVAHMQKSFASQIDRIAMAVFVSEVWTVKGIAETYNSNRPVGSLANHPDRTEGLMINAMHGSEQVMYIFPIDRSTKSLGEPEVLDTMGKGFKLEGRMTVDPPTKQ